MPLTDIMENIEQHRFSSELNLAGGTKAFRRCLRGHELFQSLLKLARDPEARLAVVRRVEELAQSEINPRYENRFDAAMSAYLTVLDDTAEPETIARAGAAAANAPNIWWTVGVSREVIAHAVATGWAHAPAAAVAWHFVPAAIVPGTEWRQALRSDLQKWWAGHEIPASTSAIAGKRILSALRAAQARAQVPHDSNVIVMPPPSETGETVVWRARGRSRAARNKGGHVAAVGHARGRQLAGVR